MKFKIITFCLLLGICFCSNAQKLPNKQEGGLRAPKRILVDGKAREWGEQFMAYNKATEIFYSIANDDENLYLVVKATNPLVIRKIIAGNITFSITPYNNNTKKESVEITYPSFNKDNSPGISLKKLPALENKVAVDSLVNVVNDRFQSKAKQIKISGFKAISDTTIPIYNEQNITVAALFDKQITYTYELALPLKYVNAPPNTILNYSIKLNGSTFAEGTKISRPVTGGTLLQFNTRYADAPSTEDMLYISTPTSFNAQYMLSK